jgi:hypothetical protein
VRNVDLPINQQAQRHEIKDDGSRNQSVPKPYAGQAFPGTVIFGNGLKSDTPPEISVNLNVPLIPSRIGGITPSFFVEQLEDRTKQVMTVPSFFTPKNLSTQTPRKMRAIRQMLMCPNYTPGRALEM